MSKALRRTGPDLRPACARDEEEMTVKMFLLLVVFWPALAGLGLFFLPAARGDRRLRGNLMCIALGLEILLVLALCFAQGPQHMLLLEMTPTLRIELCIDGIGSIFAVVMSSMWLLSAVFALSYMDHDPNERFYQVFYMAVLSALLGQCYAGSMVTLYVFYEMMTLLSVPMVVHERTPQAVSAGIKYLVYSVFGAMLGLLGIFFFHHYLGTVTFTPGGVPLSGDVPEGLLLITFMVLIGFGTKAGMFPMHGWLPTAHPVAPAPASAVLSGVITKAGVLAVLRVIYFLVGADTLRGTWVQEGFLTLTLITVFMGSMLAFREPLLKKRLAYSTVSQVSYVLFGLGLMAPTGFSGAMLHVVAHAVTKGALFLCAGAIIHQTGKTYVRELRGIGKQMPVTTWCFTIASLGLIGIPPTGGFVSKWQLATGSLTEGPGALAIVGPVVLIVSALLTAAYLLPVTIHGFFPGDDYDYASLENKEAGRRMTAPMILLSAAALLTGILAQPLMQAVAAASASIF